MQSHAATPDSAPPLRLVRDDGGEDAKFWDDAESGRTAKVLDSLVNQFNPNMARRFFDKDGESWTVPLIVRICSKPNDDARMAGLLLQYGGLPMCASVDEQGHTALLAACRSGNAQCADALLSQIKMHAPENRRHFYVEARDLISQQWANCGRTALLSAAAGLHVACISVLLRHGADPTVTDSSGNNALHLAAYSAATSRMEGSSASRGSVDDDANGRTGQAMENANLLFHTFCEPGHLDLGSANQYSSTPLHLASSGGVWTLVALILDIADDLRHPQVDGEEASSSDDDESRAVVSSRTGTHHLDVKDDRGMTPLHRACQGNHIRAAELLLNAGFSTKAVSLSLQTPVQLLVRSMKHHDESEAALWLSHFQRAQELQCQRDDDDAEKQKQRRGRKAKLLQVKFAKQKESNDAVVGAAADKTHDDQPALPFERGGKAANLPGDDSHSDSSSVLVILPAAGLKISSHHSTTTATPATASSAGEEAIRLPSMEPRSPTSPASRLFAPLLGNDGD